MATTKNVYWALPEWVKAAAFPVREVWSFAMTRPRVRQGIEEATDFINSKSCDHVGDKIFIDCGFNKGRVLEGFIEGLTPDFNFYGFEANERYFGRRAQKLKSKYPQVLDLHFKAASTHDQGAELHVAGFSRVSQFPAECSTIVPGYYKRAVDFEGPSQPIETIDFSSWIRELHAKHSNPFIAVKMDVEGAEYDILEKMSIDGTLQYVGILAVEFHARCYDGDERAAIVAREQEIRGHLHSAGVSTLDWV